MAFSRENFQRIGGGLSGSAPAIFCHHNDTDSVATQAGAGYFNAARDELKVGDQIHISSGTTTGTGGVRVVATVPATGNVTVAALS